jgi:integrase
MIGNRQQSRTVTVAQKGEAMRARGEGSLFLRGRIYWASYYVRGKQFRESTQTSHEKEARKYLKNRLIEVGADQRGIKKFITPQNSRLTVHDLVEALRAKLALDCKLSPQNKCELDRIDTDFGAARANTLTSEAIDVYIKQRLSEGTARATINRLTTFLSRAYRLSIERKHLVEMPTITHLTENNARKGFFSRPEFDTVLGFLPEDLKDFCLFGFLTGWRKGEISSLTWTNIHDGVIRLDAEASKNGEARSVVIAGELVQVIERRQGARFSNGVLTNLVFHRDGQPIKEFRKAWASACRQGGMPGKIFHDLRRSAIRSMLRSGVPQFVAMSISGHKTVSVFKRYAITTEDDQRQAMLNVEKYHRDMQSNVVAMK